MSQQRSPQPPSASHAAVIEDGGSLDQSVFDIGQIAASFGFFGLIWLDRNLIAQKTYGWLVDFVATGKDITESVLPFIGLEQTILGLESRPSEVLELPAVSVVTATRRSGKLNFTIFWNLSHDGPLALAYRSPSQTELELELSKQIRARLMAEAEVTAKSKELARANSDLESFAAIISHDLKAPLRHMRTMAEAASAAVQDREDQGLQNKLAEIVHQSQRLSKMLTELFDYSSIGRKREAIENVDTLQLAEAIKSRFPASGITISIDGSWPAINTLKAPLDLALRNLVSNALQHHDRTTGHISMHCAADATALIFSISDDGPGIASRNHKSIFEPFRTLASRAEVASTGMGLAMVKKTVEGCGGRIDIESAPEKSRGTKFTIVWPKYLDPG